MLEVIFAIQSGRNCVYLNINTPDILAILRGLVDKIFIWGVFFSKLKCVFAETSAV